MTPESRKIVLESWSRVLPVATVAAEIFYDRLLDLDPQLGRLFRSADPAERGHRFIRRVSGLVSDVKIAVEPSTCAGRDAPGWDDPHLAVVGNALLAMLERVLRGRFTPRVRAAWRELCAECLPELRRAALGEAGASRVVPLVRGSLAEVAG